MRTIEVKQNELLMTSTKAMTLSMVDSLNRKAKEAEEHHMVMINRAAGIVKQVCGVANAMFYWTMMDAMDKLKDMPQCRQTAKKMFKDVRKDWDTYENRLRHESEKRFFHVADFSGSTFDKYRKDITDAEYFQLWKDMCNAGYQYYSKELKVLRLKYERILRRSGREYATAMSYVLLCDMCGYISADIWRNVVKDIAEIGKLHQDVVEQVFDKFLIQQMADKWNAAIVEMYKINPGMEYMATKDEMHDITLSTRQLGDRVMKESSGMNPTIEAVEMNSGVFRDKRTYRSVHKALRQMQEEEV